MRCPCGGPPKALIHQMASYGRQQVHEFIPNRLYYVSLSHEPRQSKAAYYFSTDHTQQYWNFFLDFGPLNLGQLYRFCEQLNKILRDPKHKNKKIYYYSSTNGQKRANSAVLICCWAVAFLGLTANDAYKPFVKVHPGFPPFHDASPCICTYNLTVLDCVRGFAKAQSLGFVEFKNGNFPIDEYEHYEKVEYGDLSWIRRGKFCAFAGPHNSSNAVSDCYITLTPEHYIPYFKKRDVKLVIRLNKKYYDKERFTREGFRHVDMYFLDGSTPSDKIVDNFLGVCESEPSGNAIAVHCKAGLGRTGSLLGCFFMKHYGFTAAEFIGWVRICRPGSVIGPQQHFLREMQPIMWSEGKEWRARRGIGSVEEFLRKEALMAERGITVGMDKISSDMKSVSLAMEKKGAGGGGGGGGGGYDHRGKYDYKEEAPRTQGDLLRQVKSPKSKGR